ncbi:MAG: cardiolipin synthase [Hyphomicrobiaceae bacterium]
MFYLIANVTIVLAFVARILLRPKRQPESRMAWLVVVVTFPVVGVVAYILLGETNIGEARTERLLRARDRLPRPDLVAGGAGELSKRELPERHVPLFNVGRSISGYEPVGGNRASLMADSDSAIDAMVADIDAATVHVHLVFYIWLNDTNGTKMVDALKRAAARGVTCRAMVDDLGSRELVRSQQWADLARAGVHVARSLIIGNPFLRILKGRVDLRDHRKILVIDNRITYCGSQNCADAAFLPKAKYAPWVDAVMRFEGPVVRQNQHLFASGWMAFNPDDDICGLFEQPMEPVASGFVAQVVSAGPTTRDAAMPEMFESLLYAARRELVITTPYYVPGASIQAALCAAAHRGVDTTLIVPARVDDFAVAAACRSYYEGLLSAGVKLYEFVPGLLHTKSVTVDGEVTLIGSANLDRRSFDLNFENNILLSDEAVTTQMRVRQEQYLAQSRQVTLAEVQAWSLPKRLWNNTAAIVGPLL